LADFGGTFIFADVSFGLAFGADADGHNYPPYIFLRIILSIIFIGIFAEKL